LLALFVAAAITAGSVALSQHSFSTTNPKFLQLSIVPIPLSQGADAKAAKISVDNLDGVETDVLLRIYENGRNTIDYAIDLAAKSTWSHSIDRPDRQKIRVTISMASRPANIVRSVFIDRPVD
jgi:hypothetical protein